MLRILPTPVPSVLTDWFWSVFPMLKPFADYRLGKNPVLILEKTAILALYGYRRYNEKIKHLATKCWLGASFAKFTLYVNSDGGDEEDRTLYLLNAIASRLLKYAKASPPH